MNIPVLLITGSSILKELKKTRFYTQRTIQIKSTEKEISITTEECMCHGGRMWINGNHSTNHFALQDITRKKHYFIFDNFFLDDESQFLTSIFWMYSFFSIPLIEIRCQTHLFCKVVSLKHQ